jgi:hypothetical protein
MMVMRPTHALPFQEGRFPQQASCAHSRRGEQPLEPDVACWRSMHPVLKGLHNPPLSSDGALLQSEKAVTHCLAEVG